MLNTLNALTDTDMLFDKSPSMRKYTEWNGLTSRFIIILNNRWKNVGKKPHKKHH